MNFFEHQDQARRNTRVLVLLYALAVLAVVAAVDAVLLVAWVAVTDPPHDPRRMLVWGAVVTAGTIFLVSFFKVLRLRRGGEAIARMIGAARVDPGTRDPLERRLVNVVEEMAIAAGTRVPDLYVMGAERGINAFAAGHDVSSAIIVVTRGALEQLNRDELQGVVGHEYSHIVNGDMRLNLRMVGVLAGIVFIGSVGEFLMRSGSRGRGRNSGSPQVALLGLALMLIGYIGLFFARLIKAAVSRQREFLADASSVQFTRNPAGIAGALDQIRACGAGTLVDSRHAEDLSHMFFGQAVKLRFATAFATHPPLEERIRRVMPGFAAQRYRASRGAPAEASAPAPAGKRAGDSAHAWGRSAGEALAVIGTLDAANVDYAHRLIARIPAPLIEAMHTPEAAPGAVLALLLAHAREPMELQLAAIGTPALAAAARTLAPEAAKLGAEFRLPVVDLALPALKRLDDPRPFLDAVLAVASADRRLSLQEFVVLTLLRLQLEPAARPPRADRSVSQLRDEVVLLLSVLAHAGSPEAANRAFLAGAKALGLQETQPLARSALSPESIGGALEKLRTLAPLAKGELVNALFAAISVDGKVRVTEAELMRLVGAALACPVPPLFDSLS